MKQFITDLVKRLSSRKFLLALGGAYVLYQNKQWGELVALLLGFIAAEGGADIVDKIKTGTKITNEYRNGTSQNDEFEVDTTKIETGKPTNTPLFDEEIKE